MKREDEIESLLYGLLLRREIGEEDLLAVVVAAIERTCGPGSIADSIDDLVDGLAGEEAGRYMLRSAHVGEVEEKDEEIEKVEKAAGEARTAYEKAKREYVEEVKEKDEELAKARNLLGLPLADALREIEALREELRAQSEYHAREKASDLAALRRVEESARERVRVAERAEWKLRTDAREALFAAYEATFRLVREKARAAAVVAVLDDLEKLAARIQAEAGRPNPGFMFRGMGDPIP